MSDLLIAVGGTGQHVALAVSRLVFLGALPPLELATIDADDNQELSTSLKTFGQTVEAGYTTHPLTERAEKIYSPFDKTVREDPEFQDLFLGTQLDSSHKDIFEVCFDEVSAQIHVKDGMFGRPSVGATIFAHNTETMLKPVFERINLANNIFIAGSVVGGTGAGLIHQLVKKVDARRHRIFGLIFLRWFNVPRGAAKQTIDDNTQDRNMRYGLDYFFRDTRPLLKAALLIGLPDHPPDAKTAPITLEAGKTDEKKHYLHLTAAYGLLRVQKIAITEQTDGSAYAAVYDSEQPTQMYEAVWRDGRPLHWYANRGAFVKELLDYANSPKFRREVSAAFGLLGNPKNVGQGLYEAIKIYDKRQRETKIDEIMHTFGLLSEQYQFSLSWLDEVLEPLPERLHHDRYTRVKDSDAEKAKELQTIWARSLEPGVELPTPQEVAHKLHGLIVESFA
jgi:hypothetical protein